MHPPVSAERWAAIRALREGEPPTYPRLAAATDLHPATIREKALRDDWVKQKLPRSGAAKRLAERRQQEAANGLLLDAAGLPLPPADWPAAGSEAGQEVAPEELRQRFAEVLSRQLGQIIAFAERGVVDKPRIDALVAMGRALERMETLAEERAAEKQKRSDEELAEMLEKIDDRIVELAEVYAEQLVAERDRAAGG